MSTIKSSSEHLVLNADGTNKDIKFQANGVEKASISSTGAFTSTSIDATKLSGTVPNFTSTGIDDNATSTAITIDASENVGIGVVPKSDFVSTNNLQIGSQVVVSNWSQDLHLSNNSRGTSAGWKYIATKQAANYYMSNGMHVFRVAPSGTADTAITWTTAMTIDNSGRTIVGSNTSGTWQTALDDNDPYFRNFVGSTSYRNHFFFKNPNGDVGSISTSSSSTSYNTSSDYRLKENVKPMSASIDRLKQLKPCNFNFKADADTTVDGFLAHEAQEVVPEAVTGTKDAMRTEEYEVEPAVEATYDDEGNELTPAVEAVMGEREVPDYQGIDQAKLVPLLTSALQEAVAKIEALEARIETLEAN